MNKYELMLILDPKTEVTKAKDVILEYLQAVKEAGKVLKVDVWGRKHLSYPILKHDEGFYAVVDFESNDSELPKEVSRQLKINDNVLRFKLLKKENN